MARRRMRTTMAWVALATLCSSQTLPVEAEASITGLPAAFVPNVGQWDDGLLYAAPLAGGAVQVRRDGLWLRGGNPEAPGLARLTWDGAAIGSAEPGAHTTPVHIFGPGSRRWERLPGRVDLGLPGVAPGLDLRLAARGGMLHLQIEAVAGELPLLRFEGGELSSPDSGTVTLDAGGASLTLCLRSATRAGSPIDVRAVLVGQSGVALQPSDGSDGSALTLQADLVWSTFLGGSSGDGLAALEVLSDQSIVVAGATISLDFPVTPNAAEPTGILAVPEGFLSRLSADGSTLLYSTYLTSSSPGTVPDSVFSNGTDRATVVGYSQSTTLPTTPNAFQPLHAGISDGFLAEYDLDSGALIYCSYLGTPGADGLTDGAYAADGTLYLVGSSNSPTFPTTPGAYQEVNLAFFDGIVVRLDTSAARSAQLLASTFLGGTGSDSVLGVEITSAGDIVVFGHSAAPLGEDPDFPVTPGAFFLGPYEVGIDFIARLDPTLENLLFSTQFGAAGIKDLAVDSAGRYAICGSGGFTSPVTPGTFDDTPNGSFDLFVGVLSADGSSMDWGTLLGGAAADNVHAIDIDDSGAVVVTGQTSSLDFPVTPGAFDVTHSGGLADPFMSIFTNEGTTLGYSSFLGPSTSFAAAYGVDVELVGPGEVVVGGKAVSPAHPVTPGAYDETPNDIFIAHLSVDLTWADLGQGLAGSAGIPMLAGSGELSGGSLVTVQASRALALSTAWFVLGLAKLQAPFKGGTLVPSPDLYAPVPVNGTGQASVSFTWPVGIPAGLPTYYQVWVVDPSGPKGFAASNGLQGLSQ